MYWTCEWVVVCKLVWKKKTCYLCWLHNKPCYQTSIHSTRFSHNLCVFLFCFVFSIFSPCHLHCLYLWIPQQRVLSCPFQFITEHKKYTPGSSCMCVAVCIQVCELENVCVCQDTASICRAPEGSACLVSGGQQERVCVALRVQSSAISCSSARTALTQVQCTVKLEAEWGIRRMRSKQLQQ